MAPFGIMMIVQPAALCLVIGIALAVTGVTWLFLIRRYAEKRQLFKCVIIFIVMSVLYALLIYYKYGIAVVYIEMIRGLV